MQCKKSGQFSFVFLVKLMACLSRGNSKHFLPPLQDLSLCGKKLNIELSFETQSPM